MTFITIFMPAIIILLPEEISLVYFLFIFLFFLEAAFIYIFVLNEMLAPVLKNSQSEHNAINKGLFIYKQRESPPGNREKIKIRNDKQWLWQGVWGCLLCPALLEEKPDCLDLQIIIIMKSICYE